MSDRDKMQAIPESTSIPPLAPEQEENEEVEVGEDEPSPEKRSRKKFRRPVFSDTISAVPVAAFHRLVREIAADMGKEHIRWEARALEALQVDTEAFASEKFIKADKQRLMCKRRTVGRKHWRAVNS